MKRADEIKGLREKSELELEDELRKAYADQFKFRTDMAMRSLADVKSIRNARKRIARILTLQRERELVEGETAK